MALDPKVDCYTMPHSTYAIPLILLAFQAFRCAVALPAFPTAQTALSAKHKDARVLILGGGVAGVMAARTLHEQGIDDFIIVEARHELGGRMMSHTFGAAGEDWTVEVGANWVQGTQTGSGPANPVWELAKKHNISLRSSHDFMSVGKCLHQRDHESNRLTVLDSRDV